MTQICLQGPRIVTPVGQCVSPSSHPGAHGGCPWPTLSAAALQIRSGIPVLGANVGRVNLSQPASDGALCATPRGVASWSYSAGDRKSAFGALRTFAVARFWLTLPSLGPLRKSSTSLCCDPNTANGQFPVSLVPQIFQADRPAFIGRTRLSHCGQKVRVLFCCG
jgi:hypothetical protein